MALHLSERGAGEVVVLERTGIGAGASGVQPGGVRQQWGTRVNCLLARESVGFYGELVERLEARVDPHFRACGYVFLAHSEPALAQLGANVELQNGLGIPSRVLSPIEAAERVEGLVADSLTGAAVCEEDGYFDRPQAVVEAFAEAARRSGVRVERRGVRSLARDGAAWSIDGTLLAGQVVVAAGYDTPALLGPLGVDLPIRREARFLFLGEPVPERLLEPLVVSPERRFAAKQLADGRLLASDLGASGDPATERERWRARIKELITDLLPPLEFVPLPRLVEGLYDVTPDHQAAIGPVAGHEGLFVAAGFSGHGFMIAPAVGRGVAAMVLGEEPGEPFAALGPERFATGALVPEPQIV
ncbi:MAG: FAD-binding oxidoreductase [Actinobacteria bacterium]|nr:FAD-binding oxidoreductase [Actinomycetota bacterium]